MLLDDTSSLTNSPCSLQCDLHTYTNASDYYDIIESHQYEPEESEVWKAHQFQRHILEDQLKQKYCYASFVRIHDVNRWLLTLIIGVACGLIAIFITFFTHSITTYKLEYFLSLIEQEKEKTINVGSALFMLLCSNIVLIVIAWSFVYIEPLAAGSGIPEIKCFLNGINIPRIVRLKTMICKAIGILLYFTALYLAVLNLTVLLLHLTSLHYTSLNFTSLHLTSSNLTSLHFTLGIIFSCCTCLPLGKEGPMVHIGAVIASGLSQGKTSFFGVNTSYQDFRNDKEKRDFVACGAAAGVAAAFASPIGGVLFSLEEGSSFWSTKLTWRCFFCAMATLFTIYTVNTASSFFASSLNNAMFSFGKFYSLLGERSNYSVWELLLFMLMGAAGGVLGAMFNYANLLLFRVRKLHIHKYPLAEVFEAIFITCIFTIISFVLSALWTKCTPIPIVLRNEQERDLVAHLVQMYCPNTHYNELASLYLVNSDIAIKQLFHFRELGDTNDKTFSSTVRFTSLYNTQLCFFTLLHFTVLLFTLFYFTLLHSTFLLPS